MTPLIIFHAVILGPALLLPWRWVWAWFNLIALAFSYPLLATSSTLTGRGSTSDTLAFALLLWIVILLCIAAVLRVVFHAMREDDMTMQFDHPIFFLLHLGNGITLGIGAALISAALISGAGAITIHVVLVVLSITPLFFLLYSGVPAIYFGGVAVGGIMLALLSATYPASILSSARATANGEPFCIYLNQSKRFTSNSQDLTFLTFDKGDWTAHAVLIIGSGDTVRYGNWSYHQRQFMMPWDLHTPEPTLQCPANH
ncbi:hypothetical protein [Yoonia maritima]|uniref:hypothetical protein n=1 Tax=Yoonia maritima TaxID=1435347 RepID=UPI0013A650C1|nr:hypothetical protein [Yoonia maritima]